MCHNYIFTNLDYDCRLNHNISIVRCYNNNFFKRKAAVNKLFLCVSLIATGTIHAMETPSTGDIQKETGFQQPALTLYPQETDALIFLKLMLLFF